MPTEVRAEPFPVLLGLPYRMALEIVAGQVIPTIRHPILWYDLQDEPATWVNVAAIGDALGVIVEEKAHAVHADGETIPQTTPGIAVSEIRTWRDVDDGKLMLGICNGFQSLIFRFLLGLK